MTLKEKFDKVMIYPFSEYKEQMKVLKEENSIEYLKIADEFAIGFAEWVIQLLCSHIDSLAHQLYTDNDVTQLLEIYKKEKGL